MSEDIYVLCLERDHYDPSAEGARPIVCEQYLDQGAASLEAVQQQQKKFGDRFGKTRIAKLQFIDEQ